MNHPNRLVAFTLIELLVVITIIVVLLSLLTPALDRAIYRAELLVCATQERVVLTGAQTYAMGHRRRYPQRPQIGEVTWEANALTSPFESDAQGDLRPLIRDYFGINAALNDPFTEEVDYADSQDSSFIFTPYNLWFGFKFFGTGSGAGMSKMGDRWSFTTPDGRVRRFNLMINDHDFMIRGESVELSHPDQDGVTTNVKFQDASIADGGSGSGSATATLGQFSNLNATLSLWWFTDNNTRGAFDMQAGYDDGSVTLIEAVTWEETDPSDTSIENRRLTGVPQFSDVDNSEGYPDAWDSVPLR